jgi:hypothetical protein
MLQPKFNVGKVTVSAEAHYTLVVSGQDADFFLQKHASGDWGDCDPAIQERGLREGSIVVSRFRTLRGKIIVVTTLLAKGETSLYSEFIVDAVSVNHGFTYDTGPVNPGVEYDGDPGFKYDGDFGPVATVPVLLFVENIGSSDRNKLNAQIKDAVSKQRTT